MIELLKPLFVVILIGVIVIGVPSIYIFFKKLTSKLIIDKRRNKRILKPEITRDKFNTSDSISLELIQNDPWDFNAIVIGVPTFLSTTSEYKDLSNILENKKIKFICSNLRDIGWKGNSNNINLGTIIKDINELIESCNYYYPNKDIFLLGQSFGSQLIFYINQNNYIKKRIKGLILANPLDGSVGINYGNYTYLTFILELLRFKYRIQFFDIRQILPKIDKMTNNNSYKREMKELFKQKFIHGIPLKYIAQSRYIINLFWKKINLKNNDIFLIQTKEDDYQNKIEHLNKFSKKTLGNHLVFTDFMNEEVINFVVEWINNSIK